MKYFVISLIFLLINHYSIGQNENSLISKIDKSVSQIETVAKIFKTLYFDTSKYNSSYEDKYFIIPSNKKLAKVEFILKNPDVKVTYYFLNDDFIKTVVVDKSIGITLSIHSYFDNGKLIFTNQQSGHSNGGKVLITDANNYLAKYKSLQILD